MKRTRWFTLFLAIILVVSFAIPSFGTTTLANQGETITLKVLHTNDIHASIDGMGKMAAYIQAQRQLADYSLYLDAGDIFSGNPVVDLQKGRPIIHLLNELGLQAFTIGNHEFDYGQEDFALNVQNSAFPWLSANMNVVDPTIPIQQPDPYHIFDLGEVKVGVVSITEAPPSTAPANIVGIEFDTDYAAVARQYEFLKDEVDVLIALTHIGYPEDRQLAAAVDFFDLIIGGHSHTTLNQPGIVNGTPIVQTGSNGRNVGNVTLTLDKQTKKVVGVQGFLQSVEQLVEVDPEVQALIDNYNAEMDEILGKVIGYSNTGLTRDGRTARDVALGNFWTDAMRDALGTDIALTNNGGIRDSIPSGELTAKHIYIVEPFANEIMEFRLTGQALKNVIKHSYTRDGRNQIDLQTSGLTYEIFTDASRKYVDAELKVNGQPIDLEATYTIAIPDYIGTGGGGYEFVGDVIQPSAGFMTNAMIGYAEKLMDEKGVIDYPSTEGRIKITVDPTGGDPGTVIGSTTKGLSDTNKARMDAGLGNLYTDAVRAKVQADIGLLNGSSVTGSIPAGDITDKQIQALDNFGNEVIVVKTTGNRIKEVILSQANFYGTVDVQVSGLHYELVPGSGAQKFSDARLTNPDGSAFDLQGEYVVAYNDYMHDRSFYNLGTELVGSGHGKVWEAVLEYVQQHSGPIDYVEGQRIQIEGAQNPNPELPEGVISVAEAIANNSGTATVQGYIVGTMTWNFDGVSAPFQATNLLLADSPDERDRTKILPVQLPQGQIRTALNLLDHPENLGKAVRITGTLDAYFSQPGLRTPSAYEFVQDSNPEPEYISVAEAIANNSGTATVQGYIVGTMNWNFDGVNTPFQATNLLLADSPDERDYSKILPVQLPQGQIRAALNLLDHPENLGKAVRITGTLDAYFAQPGLRSPSAYEFVEIVTPEPDYISVADAIANNSGTATVQGYIVGTMNWNFDGEAAPFQATNLLLADSPDERERTKLLPVQLPQGQIRTALNLLDHPENLGKKVKITGTLDAYFSQPGLRSPSAYEFVQEVIPQPDPEPEFYTLSEARELSSGEKVTVEGVVTTNTGLWGAKGFYLQDQTAGAYVHQSTVDVQPGDVVRFSAQTGLYNGEFQLSNVTQLEKVGQAQLPAALTLTPAQVSKTNEGQLVTLSQVTITELQSVNQYGTFEFKAIKGNEEVIVRVDNRTGLVFNDFTFQNGDVVDVTGISSQFNGLLQVKPRMSGDIVASVVEEPQQVDFNSLYQYIDSISFKNHGSKVSLLTKVTKAEEQLNVAQELRKAGQEKQANQQAQNGLKSLDKAKKDVEKGNKGIAEENQQELVRLIDALKEQYQ